MICILIIKVTKNLKKNSHPCNLKIKIRCGKTELITDILKNVQDEIKDMENMIKK